MIPTALSRSGIMERHPWVRRSSSRGASVVGLPKWSSAASVASPLQRRVRPTSRLRGRCDEDGRTGLMVTGTKTFAGALGWRMARPWTMEAVVRSRGLPGAGFGPHEDENVVQIGCDASRHEEGTWRRRGETRNPVGTLRTGPSRDAARAPRGPSRPGGRRRRPPGPRTGVPRPRPSVAMPTSRRAGCRGSGSPARRSPSSKGRAAA